jgi:hypothetical protein
MGRALSHTRPLLDEVRANAGDDVLAHLESSDDYADTRHTRQPEKPVTIGSPEHRVGIAPRSAQFVYGLLGADWNSNGYGHSDRYNRVQELTASGIRLVIDEFRADVTKTRNYPDCLVMPTLVGSVDVLAAG